jgi:D-lactate dehydrogenase
MTMKILFFSTKSFEAPYLEEAMKQFFETSYTRTRLSVETASLSKGYDVVSVFTGDDVSAPVVEALKNNGVRFIAIRAAGFDNVDIDKANESEIRVANVPAYSPNAVAEHAVAMMLALDRKLVLANQQVHDQNFTLDNLVGFDLYRKTVGIIGTGKIGSVVARILEGFGCRLLAFDLKKNQELERNYHVQYTDLHELCSRADIITIHTPLNESTRYMINKSLLQLMKKGIMLINTSRGGLINTSDLIKFLESGHIGYFGMDVYEKEQGLFFYDHSGTPLNDELLKKLMARSNVLITPHQAFATKEALTNIAETTFYTVERWSRGLHSGFELTSEKAEVDSLIDADM